MTGVSMSIHPAFLFLLLVLAVGCTDPRPPPPPEPAPDRHIVDVAIVTVIAAEYRAMLQHLRLVSAETTSPGVPNAFGWQRAEIDSQALGRPLRLVVALAGEAGTTSGALAALSTAARWQPRHVLLVGIAGGLPPHARLGDVVVSELVWGYEYGAVDAEFQPRRDWTYRADEELLGMARTFTADWQRDIRVEAPALGVRPAVVIGTTASGNKVVESTRSDLVRRVMRAMPDAASVEMEGAGALAAMEVLREGSGPAPGLLMIRGISDVPESGPQGPLASKADREKWKAYAADAAAAYAAGFLRHAWKPVDDARGADVDVLFVSTQSASFSAVARRLEPSSTGVEPVPWARGRIASVAYPGSYEAVAVNAGARIDRDTMATIFATWRPRYCVVVDAALGLAGQAEVGDVVAARLAWVYRRDGSTIVAEWPSSYRASRSLIDALQSLGAAQREGDAPGRVAAIRFGALAVGPQALSQRDIEQILALNPRTLAVDEETAAIAHEVATRAARGARIGMLSVQSIARTAGAKTPPAGDVAAAADVAFELVRRAWPVAPATLGRAAQAPPR